MTRSLTVSREGFDFCSRIAARARSRSVAVRRRIATACVCSRGLAPPRAAPRLHSAWPWLLAHASATLLPVPQARRLGGLPHRPRCSRWPVIGGSSARPKSAPHSAHGGLRATLPACDASPRLAVWLAVPHLAPGHEGCACGGHGRAASALGRSRGVT